MIRQFIDEVTLTTNQRLRLLMAEHNLTRQDICLLLGLRPNTRYSNHRLDRWLMMTANQNPMPDHMLELLEIKLAKFKPRR